MLAGVTEDGAGGRGNKKNPTPTLAQGLARENETPASYDVEAPTRAPETIARVAEMVGAKRSTFRKEREVYQTATGQRPVPAEVKAVAEEQLAKLDAGRTTVNAAAREIAKAKGVQAHLPQHRKDDATITETNNAVAALNRRTGGRIERDRALRAVENAINTIATHDAATIAQAADEDIINPSPFDASVTNLAEWIDRYRTAQADRHRIVSFVQKGA